MKAVTSKHDQAIAFEDTDVAKPLTAIPATSARLSLAAAATFLVLVAALHVIKPEFDPSWRFISEYAIGDYGWMMVLAFLSLALSCVTSFIAIRSQIGTAGGKIGLALLLAVAAALATAGIFVMDPITASKDELTTHGNLHGLASMVGIPGLPIAAVLISRSLARNQAWLSARRSLRWTAHLTWITLLLMFATMAVMLPHNDGAFGPDVLIGWPNRLLVGAYSGWLMVVAWHATQLNRQGSWTGVQQNLVADKP